MISCRDGKKKNVLKKRSEGIVEGERERERKTLCKKNERESAGEKSEREM